MKADERQLLTLLQQSRAEYPFVKYIAAEIGMDEKRAEYLCHKWTRKGWYEWGSNPLKGWLTTEGKRAGMLFAALDKIKQDVVNAISSPDIA